VGLSYSDRTNGFWKEPISPLGAHNPDRHGAPRSLVVRNLRSVRPGAPMDQSSDHCRPDGTALQRYAAAQDLQEALPVCSAREDLNELAARDRIG